MSISSMTNVAREHVMPSGGAGRARGLKNVADAAQGQSAQTDQVTAALDVIMAYIPTEILTLYVAVLAALRTDQPNGSPSETVFWAFLFATPVVVWLIFAAKLKAAGKGEVLWTAKGFPLWEMFAATVAYAAWAFALPESPFFEEHSALAGILVLVVATVLGLLAPIFRPPAKTEG